MLTLSNTLMMLVMFRWEKWAYAHTHTHTHAHTGLHRGKNTQRYRSRKPQTRNRYGKLEFQTNTNVRGSKETRLSWHEAVAASNHVQVNPLSRRGEVSLSLQSYISSLSKDALSWLYKVQVTASIFAFFSSSSHLQSHFLNHFILNNFKLLWHHLCSCDTVSIVHKRVCVPCVHLEE